VSELEVTTKKSHLSGVTLFGFGSRDTPLTVVTIDQTVVRAGRGVGTLSGDQVTP
jgi:hypothetical protein